MGAAAGNMESEAFCGRQSDEAWKQVGEEIILSVMCEGLRNTLIDLNNGA